MGWAQVHAVARCEEDSLSNRYFHLSNGIMMNEVEVSIRNPPTLNFQNFNGWTIKLLEGEKRNKSGI